MCGAQTLRQYVPSLLGSLQQQVAADNEENAILAMRLIFEFFKNFRPQHEETVKGFMTLVQQARCQPCCTWFSSAWPCAVTLGPRLKVLYFDLVIPPVNTKLGGSMSSSTTQLRIYYKRLF